MCHACCFIKKSYQGGHVAFAVSDWYNKDMPFHMMPLHRIARSFITFAFVVGTAAQIVLADSAPSAAPPAPTPANSAAPAGSPATVSPGPAPRIQTGVKGHQSPPGVRIPTQSPASVIRGASPQDQVPNVGLVILSSAGVDAVTKNQAIHEAGRLSVLDTATITQTFVLVNDTDSILTIDHMTPSCSCTTAVAGQIGDLSINATANPTGVIPALAPHRPSANSRDDKPAWTARRTTPQACACLSPRQ